MVGLVTGFLRSAQLKLYQAMLWVVSCTALMQCGPSIPKDTLPIISPSSTLPPHGRYCPNEYLKWSLRWKGLEAATTELMTGVPGLIEGEDAIVVFSRSHSSDLASVFREVLEELTSQVSLKTGSPLSNESLAVENGEREHVAITFSSSDGGYKSHLTGTVKQHEWSMSGKDTASATDLHTFLARLRIWDGSPSSGVSVFVQNGRSHYEISLVQGKPKSISTPMGTIPVITIHGQAKRVFMDGRKRTEGDVLTFTFWRSDDSRFLPVRFDAETRLGIVRGTLVDERNPDLSTCLRAPRQ